MWYSTTYMLSMPNTLFTSLSSFHNFLNSSLLSSASSISKPRCQHNIGGWIRGTRPSAAHHSFTLAIACPSSHIRWTLISILCNVKIDSPSLLLIRQTFFHQSVTADPLQTNKLVIQQMMCTYLCSGRNILGALPPPPLYINPHILTPTNELYTTL